MKLSIKAFFLFCALVCASLYVHADEALQGAWMFVESEFEAPPPVEGGYAVERRAEIARMMAEGTWPEPVWQPRLVIFTDGHYSMNAITTDKERTLRPPVPRGQITDEQKLLEYSEIRMEAGEYWIEENELVFRPLVTPIANDMLADGSNDERIEYHIEGDKLYLTRYPGGGTSPANDIYRRLD